MKYNYSHAKIVSLAIEESVTIGQICDLLSENPALCANIEFELETILSVPVVSQLNSDYYTNVSQEAWLGKFT